MNDADMLAVTQRSLRRTADSLTDVRLDDRPEAIMARARRRRMRGVAGAGTGGLALAAGLALAFSGIPAPGTGGDPGDAGGSSQARAVHVNLAAWSVNTSTDGLVEVTIRELKDPARLSQTLTDAGVPAVLTSGPVCDSDDKLDVSRVVSKLTEDGDLALSIDPRALPAGSELVIGVGTLRTGSHEEPGAAIGIRTKGTALHCGKP